RSVGLFVVALQGQEIVTTLALDLISNGRLAAHRIDGHNTAFDGKQVQKVWNGRDLIGLAVRLQLADDNPPHGRNTTPRACARGRTRWRGQRRLSPFCHRGRPGHLAWGARRRGSRTKSILESAAD